MREVATLFAHFTQESSQNNKWLQDAKGIDLWRQGLYYINELGCGPGFAGNGTPACDYIQKGWADEAWPSQENAQYHGRGPFQLSYNFNYGQFSNVFIESKYHSKLEFLEHPENVAKDAYTAFSAAIWFYMTPQSPKPSMHDVMCGLFKPNEIDENFGIKGGFGTTINIINGGVECGGSTENKKASNRGDYFQEFLNVLGLDPSKETNLGCAGEKKFPDGSAGDLDGYFVKGAIEN